MTKRAVAACGTVSGYNRHKKNGESACADCLLAQRKYHRIYNDKRRLRTDRREAARIRRLARNLLTRALEGDMDALVAVRAAAPLFDLADKVEDGPFSYGLIEPGENLTHEELLASVVTP